MKREKAKKGFVLVTALVVTLVVGMIAVSMVGLTLQEYRLSMRSAAYSEALHAAESGAALACQKLAESREWTASRRTGILTNALGAVISSYSISGEPSRTNQYIITSTGQVELAGTTIQRTVRVTVQQVDSNGPYFKYGLLSKAAISMGGSVSVDSFDSTDPAKSTNGQYDPAKAGRDATLATLSTNRPAITVTGGAELDGISCLSVPEGATVSIAHWISYTGLITYDAAQDIEDVSLPFAPLPTGTINVGGNQTQTLTVSGSRDLSLESLSVGGSGSLIISGSGTLRIYVDGETTVDGAGKISISPSPSTAELNVEIYANGNMSIAGSGVLNNTYLPSSCSIWGTENCTSISITGNSAYIGTIYAPYAEVKLTGSSGATGAFLGGAVTFTGASGYHIDESLIGKPSSSSESSKPYTLIEWIEI